MASNGRIWRVKIKNSIGNYVTFAGVKEESLTFGNKAIDITDKQSDGYRYQLARGGQSADLSCSGVAIDNDGYHIIKRAVRDNTFVELLMESEYDRLLGSFHISNYSEDAAHDGAVNFTASFSSTAAYTYQIPFQVVANGVLDSGATFTRASTATYFGSDGLLKTAAVNEARNEFDPVTGENLGLLVEEQRTNLAKHSAEFDNVAWVGVDATISANAALSPDNVAAGDEIIASGTPSTPKAVYQQGMGTLSGSLTVSVYVKKNTHRWVQLFLAGDTNGVANFDLDAGDCYLIDGTSCSMEPVGSAGGGNWYRITMSCVASSASGIYIALANSASSSRFEATSSTGSFYVWGAQVEAGAFPTSYIPTAASAVTRSADVATSPVGAEHNSAEFSFFASGYWNGAFSRDVLFISDGTQDNQASVLLDSSGGMRLYVNKDGVSQVAALDGGALVAGELFKVAVRIKENDFAISLNGAAVVTDASGLVPQGLTIRHIGKNATFAAREWSSPITAIKEYPRALSDARLVELSTL